MALRTEERARTPVAFNEQYLSIYLVQNLLVNSSGEYKNLTIYFRRRGGGWVGF